MDALVQEHLKPEIVLHSLEEINVLCGFMWLMNPGQQALHHQKVKSFLHLTAAGTLKQHQVERMLHHNPSQQSVPRRRMMNTSASHQRMLLGRERLCSAIVTSSHTIETRIPGNEAKATFQTTEYSKILNDDGFMKGFVCFVNGLGQSKLATHADSNVDARKMACSGNCFLAGHKDVPFYLCHADCTSTVMVFERSSSKRKTTVGRTP
eukprot:5863231-Amphidinium_carterae.1